MNVNAGMEAVRAARKVVDLIEAEVGKLDQGLRPEVLSARRREIVARLQDGPEGLDALLRAVGEHVQAARAERNALADPGRALMVSAWQQADKLNPGQALFIEAAKSASHEDLAGMIDLVAGNAPALNAMLGIINGAAEQIPERAALREKVLEAAAFFVDMPAIRLRAQVEAAGLRVQEEAAKVLGGMAPAARLNLAREIETAEAIANG